MKNKNRNKETNLEGGLNNPSKKFWLVMERKREIEGIFVGRRFADGYVGHQG